jgi:hypothetical protein
MQFITRIDRERLNEIASGLSGVLSQTQTLRLHTRELERQLTGATCSTLRLLLGKQRDELHGAEAELAKRTKEVSGRTRPLGRPFPASGPASQRKRPRVDQRVMDLVEEHEAASGVARGVARRAKERGDLRT